MAGPTCRGSYALGSACGRCDRCAEERKRVGKVKQDPPTSPSGVFLLEVIPERRPGRGRWWGPHSSGYTDKVENAGVYTEIAALQISQCSDRTVMVPIEDVLEELRGIEAGLTSKRIELEARIRHIQGFVKGASS